MFGKDAELQRMEPDRGYDHNDMWDEYNRRMDFDRRHEHERRNEYDRRHDYDMRFPFWWLLFFR